MRRLLAGAIALFGLIAPADAFWNWGNSNRHQNADKAKKDSSKSPQKVNDQRWKSHWPEIGPGECGVYSKGDAELAYCIENYSSYHKDIKKMNGFLINSGKVAVCEVKFISIIPEGAQLKSFWPDWAVDPKETFIDPGQVTDMGLTINPKKMKDKEAMPGVDVDSFLDCSLDAVNDPNAALQFRILPINEVRPPRVEMMGIYEVEDEMVGDKASKKKSVPKEIPIEQRLTSHWPEVAPGECGIYTRGDAQLAYCIDSINDFHKDIKKMKGVLINRGKVPVCEVKFAAVIPEGAQLKSFWPDWAVDPKETFIDPGQVSDMGLTINPKKMTNKQAFPGIDVENFLDCSLDAVNDASVPLQFHVESIEDVRPAAHEEAELMSAKEGDSKEKNKAKKKASKEVSLMPQRAKTHFLEVEPGECGVFSRGEAELAYCVETYSAYHKDIKKMNGFLINTGKVPVCEVKFATVIPEGAQLKSLWPDWAVDLNESFIDPGQVADMGLTLNPRKMADKDAVPGVDIDSFLDCSLDAVNDESAPINFRVEPIADVRPSRVEMMSTFDLKEDVADKAKKSAPKKEIGIEQRPKSKWLEVAPGECGIYTRGENAELAYCVESVNDFHKDIKKMNGFLVNRGKVPVCDVKFAAVIPEGAQLKSFWPDWATDPKESFIDPGQVTDMGLTINPKKMQNKAAMSGVDVDSFLDCSLDAVNDVNEAIKFHVESIENVHPQRVEMMAAKEGLDGGRPRSHWPAVAPGECGVYTKGDAEFAYCVESIIELSDDIKQFNGFLVNRGKVPICDLVVAPVVPEGAKLVSFWPDWAIDIDETMVDPGHVTAMGLTINPRKQKHKDLIPGVDIDNFRDCSLESQQGRPSAAAQADKSIDFRIVDIQKIKPATLQVMSSGAFATMAAGREDVIPEGKCAIYSKPAINSAAAQVTLCVESIVQWGTEIVQVNGFLTNSGKAPLCEVRMGVDEQAKYFGMWPDWALEGKYMNNFLPGQTIAVGLTAPVLVDGSHPALFLEDFEICGHPSAPQPRPIVVPEEGQGMPANVKPLTPVLVDLADVMGAAKTPAQIAAAQGVKATGGLRRMQAVVESQQQPMTPEIPAGQCAIYRKAEGELAVCSESVVQWGNDVQQLNGFMVNTGKTSLCDVKLRTITSSGKVYSFWPDWAGDATYEVYFNPGQVTAVGMTGPPSDTIPHVELVSFRDCNADPATAKAPADLFTIVDISLVEPPAISAEDLIAMGVKGRSLEEDPTVIPEGKCGVYTNGNGKLALCIESVLNWGTDLTQVNGYLENIGDSKLCNVKIALGGAPQGFQSIWPEWVGEGSWEKDYQPKQISAIGLTVPYQVGLPPPAIKVERFTTCDSEEEKAGDLNLMVVDIAELKHVDIGALPTPPPADASPADVVASSMSTGIKQQGQQEIAVGEPYPEQQQQAGQSQQQQQDGSHVGGGRCSTYARGTAKLVFCMDVPARWGQDISQMAGQVENVGGIAVCDLHVGTNLHKAAVLSSWPAWASVGERTEDKFLPGQKMSLGFTSRPDSHPNEGVMLKVLNFRACGTPESATTHKLTLVEEKPYTTTSNSLTTQPAEGIQEGEGDEQHRNLAMKGGAEPTTWDNIKWDTCGYYTGLDGESELALCWKDAKSWKDGDVGRVVQTNLILVNTGKLGVCNVTVEIENIDQELGDHYPAWLDDDGEDIFPSYPGYYAPQQIVNIGAAVPVAKGYPEVGIFPTFTACDPPQPKPQAPRKAVCQPYSKDGVHLSFCTYSPLKEWVEYQGPRVVMVEGYIENVGQTTACNIKVDIENFANAQAKWGEWMPLFPFKLSPGATLKYGANIPMKKGIPKTSIESFEKCDDVVTRR